MNKADNKLTDPAASLIEAESSQLLIIDIQQRLAPATAGANDVIRRAVTLLNAAKILGIPHTVSEQYPKGLGPTVDDIAAVAEPGRIFDKVHFSCQADDRLAVEFAAQERLQVIVCGMEAHVCVLQTAVDLLKAGYRVCVVADAVASRTIENRDLALDRLRTSGADIATTEMVVFEWLRTAGHPDFRDVSALIK